MNRAVRDHIQVAFVEKKATKKTISSKLWTKIEAISTSLRSKNYGFGAQKFKVDITTGTTTSGLPEFVFRIVSKNNNVDTGCDAMSGTPSGVVQKTTSEASLFLILLRTLIYIYMQ